MATKTKKKSIGAQVKQALDGRTQRWLSERTGIPEDKLSNKINGIMDFTPEDIAAINSALGISL